MEIVSEEWRTVEGYESFYEVSSKGRVRSLDRTIPYRNGVSYFHAGRVLRPQVSKRWGYASVVLCRSHSHLSFNVHGLVAGAFLGVRPAGHIVNHKDGNKLNNSAENLEYLTHALNTQHAVASGLMTALQGEKNGRSKLDEEAVIEIRKQYSTGRHQRKIAAIFNINQRTVSRIVRREIWSHLA